MDIENRSRMKAVLRSALDQLPRQFEKELLPALAQNAKRGQPLG